MIIMKKLLLFIVLSLVLVSPAFACSPRIPAVVFWCDFEDSLFEQNFTCLDENCSYNVTHNSYGGLNLNLPYIRYPNHISEDYGLNLEANSWRSDAPDYEKVFAAVDAICVDNLDDIRPIFAEEVEHWLATDKGMFAGGDLEFKPYSVEKEAKLAELKEEYTRCSYYEYKKAGDWLVIAGTSRDYCYLKGGGGGMCPSLVIDYSKFPGHLVANPSVYTWLILLYAVIIAAIVWFFVYLFKRKEFLLFVRPNKVSIILTAVLGFFTVLIGIVLRDWVSMILWLVAFYLIGSLVKYVIVRLKK
ncbi:MAG: hypothetical protein ABIE94_03350 [archaeon]